MNSIYCRLQFNERCTTHIWLVVIEPKLRKHSNKAIQFYTAYESRKIYKKEKKSSPYAKESHHKKLVMSNEISSS